jgi:alpha-galactosidase
VDLNLIQKYLGDKMPSGFYESKGFNFKNLWTGERGSFASDVFSVSEIEGCGNITLKITAAEK